MWHEQKSSEQVPTVLLVDDDPNVTAGLRRAFHREPWQVVEAHSGTEALQVLTRQKIDVILTDEEMPGMSGSELLIRVRGRHPETVRMVLTGRAHVDGVIRAINEGEIYRYFLKPTQELELILSIRQALEVKSLREMNRSLEHTVGEQRALLLELERQNPGISQVERDSDGAVIID